MDTQNYINPFLETLGREALKQIQFKKYQMMLEPISEKNEFYQRKFREASVDHKEDIKSIDDLSKLPFTTKVELSSDQIERPPFGSNLTFPTNKYTHIHQTSGTTGEPLRCLDTEESWNWWARCWSTVYKAAGVSALDRVFFAFSFGPFIGFWSAFEGARIIGALAIPGGGMSSYQRVKAVLDLDISVLVCTPTYALHLAEVASHENLDIANSNVQITIHAGEPGASIPSTKKHIEEVWGARCYDHAGATEVGAWGFECQAQAGVHLNEGEFICEVIDPVSNQPADEGELVITNLGRYGMPVIRYRTGDHVRLDRSPCDCGRTYHRLENGIIGRVDDALVIRGINVFPSAIENIVRRFPEVGEFAADAYRRGELDELEIRVEVQEDTSDEFIMGMVSAIRHSLGLRVTVMPVPYGTLPRYDLKAKRFTDHRKILID